MKTSRRCLKLCVVKKTDNRITSFEYAWFKLNSCFGNSLLMNLNLHSLYVAPVGKYLFEVNSKNSLTC